MRQSGRFFVCIVFSVLVTGTAFAQVPCLSLDPSDIRLEHVYSNDTFIGYNLFVRKKAGVESVMLTEPSGYHALRSVDWNPVNGYERRELSGVPLSGAYSLYSILSSTPIYDTFLGGAFHLFVPFRVVYGNPSSSAGTAFLYMGNGVQINIRTFDHKYADPNTGRYQNNQFIINDASVPWDLQCPPESSRESREGRSYPEYSRESRESRSYPEFPRESRESRSYPEFPRESRGDRPYSEFPPPPAPPQSPSAAPVTDPVSLAELRRQLYNIVFDGEFMLKMSDDELRRVIRDAFLAKQREQRQNN
jgi:hypothetical protein